MTRDIPPRSVIKHCARLRRYLHKKYSSVESYAIEEAYIRDVPSIFTVF